jgi:hypothetical protein
VPAADVSASLYTLETVPSGAAVFINDSLQGETPWGYDNLELGPLRLRFEYPGLSPIDTLLIVREGAPLPVFAPFVFRTQVEFVSFPSGARPIIDGRLLRDADALSFELAASDTVSVVFDLRGERSPKPALLSPIYGLLPPTDTSLWTWEPGDDWSPARLTGRFARPVHLRSEPPGALVFLDGDSVPVGVTNATVDIPYGEHTVLLQKQPFLDYRFSITVAGQTPDLYAPILLRTVRFGAVDAREQGIDLKASIAWIRQGDRYIKTPEDDLRTPYSLQLGGERCEISFVCDGYADTIVALPQEASSLTVAMRRLARGEHAGGDRDRRTEQRWVRFTVQGDRRQPVSGAEVIGIDKASGDTVRYGLSDESGMVVVPVPIGDYEWQALKDGFIGRSDSERIKPGRKTKRMTLRLRPE